MIKEDLLHFLWRCHFIPKKGLCTTTGEPIEIIHVGTLNDDNGPDFSLSRVRISGFLWAGNVEMHVNASDWYLHGHQHDSRYDQVILHVVYHNDKVVENANGIVPCLELKSLMTKEWIQKYQALQESHFELPCDAYDISETNQEFTWMRDRLLTERLTTKIQHFMQVPASNTQVFFGLILEAFGSSKNKLAFRSWSEKINWLQVDRWRARPELVEVYLLGLSGLFDDVVLQSELWPMVVARIPQRVQQNEWITKGVRPAHQPANRVRMAVEVIQTGCLRSLPEAETPFDYSLIWSEEVKQLRDELKFSPFLIQQIAVNAIVPYAFYQGLKTGNADWIDFALSHVDDWKTEHNRIVTKFRRKGFVSLSAGDSQAILHLYKQYCQAKKCLSCAVGIKLMRA
jgi:hypothetical protein